MAGQSSLKALKAQGLKRRRHCFRPRGSPWCLGDGREGIRGKGVLQEYAMEIVERIAKENELA
jgi:hypothetical protein